MMIVSEARLRVATAEESRCARGGILYRMLATPLNYMIKSWNTLQCYADPKGYFTAKPPLVVRVWNAAQHALGYGEPFLQRRENFFFSDVSINDEVVLAEFFRHHRNDAADKSQQVFCPARGMQSIGNFLKECFPGLTDEEIILLCGKAQTENFHHILKDLLSQSCIESYLGTIQDECHHAFHDLDNESQIANASERVRFYFSRIFGRIIGKDAEVGIELSHCLSDFKELIFKMAAGKLKNEDIQFKSELIEKIRSTTTAILDNNPALFSGQEKELTPQAKKGLIFMLLLGAEDNTTTLLSAAMWYLAANPSKQKELREIAQTHLNKNDAKYPAEIEQFFALVLKEYPPVQGVARIAANDLCLHYKTTPNGPWRKVIFFKGDMIVGRIERVAKKIQIKGSKAIDTYRHSKNFGGGPNKCPGRQYAEATIKELIVHALANYDMSLHTPQQLKLKLVFTAVLSEDVYIHFTSLAREDHESSLEGKLTWG